jgi:hypothetical protein
MQLILGECRRVRPSERSTVVAGELVDENKAEKR